MGPIGPRPGNSAILLETGSCAIILTTVDPLSRDALRAAARSTEIAHYLRRLRAIIFTHVDPLSCDALRATEKKFLYYSLREPELPILVYSIFVLDALLVFRLTLFDTNKWQ